MNPSHPNRLCVALSCLTALSLLALPCIAVRPAAAQAGQYFQWTSVNTQGMGYVTGIVAHPLAPNDVYIRTDVGGAYRYDRTADAWVPLFDALSRDSLGNIGVESIAVDPSSAATVYAVTTWNDGTYLGGDGHTYYKSSGEVLVSTDRGAHWAATGLASSAHPIYIGANSDYRQNTGERLAIDPNQSGLLYFASSQNGVWKKNGTGAWAQVQSGLPAASSLAGYNTYDGTGKVNGVNGNAPGFTFVLFDKASGSAGQGSQTIYIGVWGSGVWRSADGGASFSLMAGSYQYPRRGVIASDGSLYISGGTDTAVWQSPTSMFGNTGAVYKCQSGAWTDITPSDRNEIYTGVTVDPATPATVMVGRDGTVWRSTNAGTSWIAQQQALTAGGNANAPGYYTSDRAGVSVGMAAMEIDPSNPNQVWWTNGWGVTRTDDVTQTTPVWTWHMKNLEELVANQVKCPPLAGGADLLTVCDDMIGFRHVSRGTVPAFKNNPANVPVPPNSQGVNGNWTVFPQPWPDVTTGTGLDYCYTKPANAVFVGFHQWQNWLVYGVSTDNGQTWNAFPTIPTDTGYNADGSTYVMDPQGGQVAMSATDPTDIVYAPTLGGWPRFTKDGGTTWSLCYNTNHPAAPNPNDPLTTQKHYTSLPTSWPNSISPWVNAPILASDKVNGSAFYYFDGVTFYDSSDGGATWQASPATGFPTWQVHCMIVTSPVAQGDVWMAFQRNSEIKDTFPLFHSVDGGKTFSTVSSVTSAELVAFGKGDSAAAPYVYLFGRIGSATQDAMYVSKDYAKTWAQISDPTVNQFPSIADLEGDMRTENVVYAALNGRGFVAGVLPLPAVPTGLKATAGAAGSKQITVTWTASAGADHYRVYHSTTASTGPYTYVGGPTGTSLTDSKLTTGKTYWYVVQAVNGSGSSAKSAPVSAKAR